MNIREILGTFSLAVGTIILFNLFFNWWKSPEDGRFVAATSQVEQAPLSLEIDFADNEKITEAEFSQVKTSYANITFSSAGAIISDLTFTRNLNHKVQTFEVWNSNNTVDREQLPFLLSLDHATPFYYSLKDKQETDEAVILTYQTHVEQGIIEKVFTVHKELHKIDIGITVKPRSAMRVRLTWPSPFLKSLEEDDPVGAVLIGKNNKFQSIYAQKIDSHAGFLSPSLFGTTDKYFVFALVKDQQFFVQRAY